jgi:hypothetical protein
MLPSKQDIEWPQIEHLAIGAEGDVVLRESTIFSRHPQVVDSIRT